VLTVMQMNKAKVWTVQTWKALVVVARMKRMIGGHL
jgi:hypothetical protein